MVFGFNDAYRIINNVIDERIRNLTRSGAGVDITWGTVAQAGTYECSVYLFGDTTPSTGFRVENGVMPSVFDTVRVGIDRRGNRWIDGILNDAGVAYPKLAINPRAGTISGGDGTAPPTLMLGPGSTIATHAALPDAHHPRLHDHSNALDGTALAPVSLEPSSLVDATLSSTGTALTIGTIGSNNIVISPQKIQARFSGARNSLHLNPLGGDILIGNAYTSVGQGLQFSTDLYMSRTAANVLTLASGDRFDFENPAARGTRVTTFSVANGSWNEVSSLVTAFSVGGVTNNGSGELVVPTAGLYLCVGKATMTGAAGGTRRIIGIGINGLDPVSSFTENADNTYVTGGNAFDISMNISMVVNLAANDAVGLWLTQNSGASLNATEMSLSVSRLSIDT